MKQRMLVACEYSGIVRDSFAEKGWEAWSCDLLPTETFGNHYQGDVRDILNDHWDLLIAHPPCTDIAVCGAKWFPEKIKSGAQQEGINFFFSFLNTHIKRVCVENPVSIISSKFRRPNQIIQPWMFGDPYSKKTCLWLKNLPKLKPTNIVDREEFYITKKTGKRIPLWYAELLSLPKEERSKRRSKTFPGIAKAMANQWTELTTKIYSIKGLITKKELF